MPFFVRVGKRLPKASTEIAIQFKAAPAVLFNVDGQTIDPNALVIRIQPDEGVALRMSSKMPGSSLRIEPVKMDFHYGTSFGKATPEAYERLLLDAMSGDATLFARRDEVEEAWKFVDAIRAEWEKNARRSCALRSRHLGPHRSRRTNQTLRRNLEAPVNATEQAPIEAGFPVEIGRIDKELGKLWEEVGDTKTRASLVNLAIFTENARLCCC